MVATKTLPAQIFRHSNSARSHQYKYKNKHVKLPIMLISLANPKNFLKKAVLLTCLLSSGVQAIPIAQITQNIDQPRAEMLINTKSDAVYTASELGLEVDSSKIQGVEFFKSKSMRGEAVQFISAKSEAGRSVEQNGDLFAFASKIITSDQQTACVVSTTVPTIDRLGSEAIHYGMSEDSGFVTNPYLARLTTSYHEFGHCLDFVSSKAHMQNQADMQIGTVLMTGMIVSDAALSKSGVIDFDYTLGKSPAQIEAAKAQGQDFVNVGVSMMEVYADLHGTFQTATATGDLSGFTDFTLSFRQSEDMKLTHSTGIAVSHIIQKEIAGGLDIASLKGKSSEEITNMVNAMFIKHFSHNGQISIHSDGFKDVIKDMSLKIELGANATSEQKASVEMLAQKTGATVEESDKSLYVGLTEMNLNHQKELVSSTNSAGNEGVSQLMAVKDAHLKHVKETLGVQASSENNIFADQNGYKNEEFNFLSRRAVSDSISKGGLEVKQEKAIDLIRSLSSQQKQLSTQLSVGL